MDYSCAAIDDRSTKNGNALFGFALLVMTRPINYYRTEFIGRGFHHMVLPLYILILYTCGFYHSKHIRNV